MTGSTFNKIFMAAVLIVLGTSANADTFGVGANQFSIDFVSISRATNPIDTSLSGGYGVVNNDYRMGVYEITNDQWYKFQANLGVAVTGNPSSAYDSSPLYTGTNVPTNNVSWLEAAQFVNWLNTSTGHPAAYKFTGEQGTSNYTLANWSAAEATGGTNLFRHKDAYYFLPTEHEWVKAAYWNGTTLQTYATKAGESLTQGDGLSGTGWNYYTTRHATSPSGPWNVGSGSEELNGTYDMMGNVWEWLESPYSDTNYGIVSSRGVRGGAFGYFSFNLAASYRDGIGPTIEHYAIGFRVASVPEPGSIALLVCCALAGLVWWRRRA